MTNQIENEIRTGMWASRGRRISNSVGFWTPVRVLDNVRGPIRVAVNGRVVQHLVLATEPNRRAEPRTRLLGE